MSNSTSNAITFFERKAMEAGEDEKFKNQLKWVSEYGLVHEVYELASVSCDENSSWEECEQKIALQMAEWDL